MAERAKEARSAAPRRKLGLVRHLQAGLKTVNEDGARKTERPSLRVTARGCAGDVNQFRKIAKGPYSDVQDGVRNCRAVSLDDTAMSDPYGLPPGCFGANVTWEGADGENSLSLRSGQRLWIGDEVVLEVTFANKPCNNLKPLFSRLKAAGKISTACPQIMSATQGPLEPREAGLQCQLWIGKARTPSLRQDPQFCTAEVITAIVSIDERSRAS